MKKTEDSNKTKKKKNNKKGKKGKIIKRIIIAILILIVVAIAIFAGLIIGMSSKYAITKEDLIIDYSNSKVVNEDGDVLAILSAKENRKILTKAEMGEYLPNAFVAIEDKRFYSHHGVDIKRTTGAVVSFILKRGEGTASGGGSTITQQLVKNITNEKEDSGTAGAVRKIKEMIRAYQVEDILSKDQILELYMNIIFLGGNVYGVGMASQYYFDKDVAELDLAESAFIAGVTNMPNTYNPFGENPKTELITKRIKTVLNEMKKAGFITQEQYDEAAKEADEGLNFKRGTIINQAAYSSHTEALINQIINQLVTEKGMDEEYAKTYLYSSGFTVYSTEVDSIQSKIEEEYSKSKYQVTTTVAKIVDGKTEKFKEDAQSAMVIIDQSNGYVVGAVGVLGEKEAFELNRVTQSKRQPGSSIKPIGVYGPAIEEKVITAASVYDDRPISYGSWSPGNAYSGYKGLSNMRQALRISQNTIAVQVLNDLTPATSISYLRKLGITSLVSDDENLSLALGGISYGITPLEMAAAYAAIANDGTYITPTFYTKIVDSSGNVILEAEQKQTEVFSKQNAFILKQLLIEPTKAGGTATVCKISGMDTAAKTGTTNSKKDKWLCGFTPYYTAATWYGYDTPTAVPNGATSNANIIWKNVMAEVHKGLDSKEFERPDGLVTAKVCMDSGLLSTSACEHDERGNRTYTEYFVKGTVPTKTCTTHVEVDVCKNSGKIAGENCTNKETKVFITRSTDNKSWKSAADAKYMLPEENCTTCKADDLAPVITLNGDASIKLKVGEKYNELGAKALDAKDGDLTSKIIIGGDTVNTNIAKTYTITYTVSDNSGNTTSKTRKVTVEEKENKDKDTKPSTSENKVTNTNSTENKSNNMSKNTVTNDI